MSFDLIRLMFQLRRALERLSVMAVATRWREQHIRSSDSVSLFVVSDAGVIDQVAGKVGSEGNSAISATSSEAGVNA